MAQRIRRGDEIAMGVVGKRREWFRRNWAVDGWNHYGNVRWASGWDNEEEHNYSGGLNLVQVLGLSSIALPTSFNRS